MKPMMKPMMKPGEMAEGAKDTPMEDKTEAPQETQAETQQAGQPQDKATETYRRLGLAAMKIIYTKEVTAQLVEIMRAGADNPAEAVAQAASTVLGILAEKVNGIDPKLVYTVTPPVVAFLLELGEAAKLFKPTPEILQQAIQMVGAKVQGGAQPQGQSGQTPMAQPQGQMPPRGLIAGGMQPQPQQMPMGA